MSNFRQNSNTKDQNRSLHLDKEFAPDLLPDAYSYYSARLKNIRKTGKDVRGNQWYSALCPFHNDKNNSFSFTLDRGGYKCWTCDARGKDVLSFHQALYNLSFVEAFVDLGAYRIREKSNEEAL